MASNPGKAERAVTGTGRNVFFYADYVFANDEWLTLDGRIANALATIQVVYYPILAIIAVPVNVLTIVALSRGRCGLSKGVTHYLVAMSTADPLVVIFDLILRQIPITFQGLIVFLWKIRRCNIHAVLLYAVTDCSVWYTVAFTFDRFVAICYQRLKTTYCMPRISAVVVGTIAVLSGLKNIFWYFMLSGEYMPFNIPWFCNPRRGVMKSQVWGSVEFVHHLLTPVVPLILVLLLNVLTIRRVLIASKVRRRLRGPSNGESPRDQVMEHRRKSLILLLVVSGNFILLWALQTVYYLWNRLYYSFHISTLFPLDTIRELGTILQLLSCCTNTALYALTQSKFRTQLKELVKFPLSRILLRIRR